MRHIKIFQIYFADAFTDKGRSIVWFLLAMINPMMVLTYWIAANASNGYVFAHYTLSSVSAYYFIVVVASSVLMAHIEESIAYIDIQEGGLSTYLLKPYSYIVLKFYSELPYRLLQGFFGILIFLLAVLFLPQIVSTMSLYSLFVGIIGSILGYILSFLFKVMCGYTTFWLTDYRGVEQIVDVLVLITAGYVMPLSALPNPLSSIFPVLPFAGIIYHPVQLLLGKYTPIESIGIFAMQLFWIVVFFIAVRILWYFGIRQFSGVGQ